MKLDWRDRDRMVLASIVGARPGLGGWFRVNCPLCAIVHGSPDRKQSFGVLGGAGVYHCFRCGSAGKVREMPDHVRAIVVSDPDADELLQARNKPDGFYYLAEEPARSSLIAACPLAYLAELPPKGRGMGEDVAKVVAEARIGACLLGYMVGRVVVPVLDTAGQEWLGWVSRVWSPKPEQCPKDQWKPYLYPRGRWRQQVLYNHRALLIETDEPCAVVEGAFDAIHVGLDNAVATLGKVGDAHRLALLAAKRPIAFVNDGDEWEISEREAMFFRVRQRRAGSVRLGPKKDPDNYPRADVLAAMRRCITTKRCSYPME